MGQILQRVTELVGAVFKVGRTGAIEVGEEFQIILSPLARGTVCADATVLHALGLSLLGTGLDTDSGVATATRTGR